MCIKVHPKVEITPIFYLFLLYSRIQVASALDRETTPSYTLTIEVSDQGTPPRSDSINVVVTIDDVNDNDPIEMQSSFTFSVAENSNVGAAVGTVVATDADAGSNAVLVYTLETFTAGNSSHFQIDSATGDITVADASLDREMEAVYEATVKVTALRRVILSSGSIGEKIIRSVVSHSLIDGILTLRYETIALSIYALFTNCVYNNAVSKKNILNEHYTHNMT